MVYDLVVLDPNEDDMKKCSTKLLDGVLALLGNTFLVSEYCRLSKLHLSKLFLK